MTLDPGGAPSLEYRLGGAAGLAATLPKAPEPATPETGLVTLRYPDHDPVEAMPASRLRTDLGEIAFFGGDDMRGGQEVLRLGTAVTRGTATAGFAVVYEEGAFPSRSEVFVDYALTDAFSVGVAGIVYDEASGADDPAARIGLNAAYATEAGTFLQGGVAHAPDTRPIFGLSLGLEF